MNAPATDRLSHVLLDEASDELSRDFIGHLAANNDDFSAEPKIHVVDYQTWELTADSLCSLYGECGYDEMGLMARDKIAWYAMYDFIVERPYDLEAEREFRTWSTQVLAADAARMLISDDPVESDECPLIIVHAGTAQQNGFIPLVRAIHQEQTERGHRLAEVYIHDGSIESIRPFAEAPVTTRQV